MLVSFKVDFYQVILPENAPSFLEIARSINAMNEDAKVKDILGHPVRPLSMTIGANTIEADFTKIRMNTLPKRRSRLGVHRKIDFTGDEGLGEDTCFIYRADTKILALQRSRSGVTAHLLAAYFAPIAGLHFVELRPIPGKEVFDNIDMMTDIKNIEVSIAKVKNLSFLSGRGFGAEKLIELTDLFGAGNIKIKLSASGKGNSLTGSNLKDFIKLMIRGQSNDKVTVRKVAITGKNPGDDDLEPIDLLAKRLVYEAEIEVADSRDVSSSERLGGVKDGIENYSEYLQGLLG